MDIDVKRPHGFALPTLDDLTGALPDLVDRGKGDSGFQQMVVTYR